MAVTYDDLSGLPKKKVPQTTAYADFSTIPTDFSGYGALSTGGTVPASTGLRPVAAPAPEFKLPDYAALINDSVAGLQSLLNENQNFDLTGRNAAWQRGVAQFGVNPTVTDQDFLASLAKMNPDLGGVIDQSTLGLARQNTTAGTSTQARIDKAFQDTVRQIKNTLAARGLLRSGAAGYELGQQQDQHRIANYDATTKLQDYLAGVAQAYADSQRQRDMELQKARMAAAGDVAQLTANVPATPYAAPAAPAQTAPVDQGGSPVIPTPAPPPVYAPAVANIGSSAWDAVSRMANSATNAVAGNANIGLGTGAGLGSNTGFQLSPSSVRPSGNTNTAQLQALLRALSGRGGGIF